VGFGFTGHHQEEEKEKKEEKRGRGRGGGGGGGGGGRTGGESLVVAHAGGGRGQRSIADDRSTGRGSALRPGRSGHVARWDPVE